jgi:Leucine-rich repeat (LRR) protein
MAPGLREIRELRLDANRLEEFNIDLSKLPKLETLSLDWFSYIVPPLKPL